STVHTPHGTMKCLKVTVDRGKDKNPLITYFGGIPLRRQKHAILHDSIPLRCDGSRNELIKRLLADACELCGAQGHCEVHHIRKLADLKVKGRKEKPPMGPPYGRKATENACRMPGLSPRHPCRM